MRQIIDRFCQGSVEELVSGMVEADVLSKSELDRLERLVKARKQGGEVMQQLLIECAVRAALIAIGTAAVLKLLRVESARARHAAWTAVVGAMLLLPVWMSWGPRASLAVLPSAPAPIVAVVPLAIETLAATPATYPVAPAVHWNWAAIVYLSGIFALLLRLAVGTWRARMLVRRAHFVEGRLTSGACAAPITVGWLRPVVILPLSWRGWSAAQLDAVLTHEGEHARRRDPLVQWLALLNRALFWFHPLAWWLERHLSALAEEACDAAVLQRGHHPGDYSAYLLELARAVGQSGSRLRALGMAMPGSSLPRRIRQILTSAPAPRPTRVRLLLLSVALAALSVLAVASVDRQAQPPVPPSPPTPPAPAPLQAPRPPLPTPPLAPEPPEPVDDASSVEFPEPPAPPVPQEAERMVVLYFDLDGASPEMRASAVCGRENRRVAVSIHRPRRRHDLERRPREGHGRFHGRSRSNRLRAQPARWRRYSSGDAQDALRAAVRVLAPIQAGFLCCTFPLHRSSRSSLMEMTSTSRVM